MFPRFGLFKSKAEKPIPFNNESVKLQYEDLVSEEEFIYKKRLGEGEYGTVYKANWNGKDVAVKRFNEDRQYSYLDEKRVLQTFSMRATQSLYLIPCYAFRENESAIVMEYMPQGDLTNYFKNTEPFNFKFILSVTHDIACGLKWLHQNSFLHRDLKTENVFFNSSGAKIGDFGTCVQTSELKPRETLSGTVGFWAPELLGDSPYHYSDKTDIYAFAILVAEIVNKKDAYDISIEPIDEYEAMVRKSVLNRKRPRLSSDCPKGLRNLVYSMWRTDPNVRPTAEKIEQEAMRQQSKLCV